MPPQEEEWEEATRAAASTATHIITPWNSSPHGPFTTTTILMKKKMVTSSANSGDWELDTCHYPNSSVKMAPQAGTGTGGGAGAGGKPFTRLLEEMRRNVIPS